MRRVNPNTVVFVTLVLVAIAFRGLVPYDPFPIAEPGQDALEDWFFRPTGQSASLICGLAASFLYVRYRVLAQAIHSSRDGASAFAVSLLLSCLILHPWSIYVGAPDLQLIALVFFCLGAGAILGGRQGFRALLFPVLFLLLLIPIPAVLANQIIYPLQIANAEASAFVLNNLLGVGATQSGTMVTTELRRFQVIESCAGLRSMATLLMSALVYSEIFHRGYLQATLLVLAAPLIGLLVNFGRVLSLMLNPAGEIAAIHSLQGLVMIVVGVLLLAALDRILLRLIGPDDQEGRHWMAPRTRGQRQLEFSVPAALVVALVAVLALSSFLIQPWQPEKNFRWSPYKISIGWESWRGRAVDIDKNAMGSVVPQGWIHRLYERGNAQVKLFVATDELLDRQTSLLSPKTVLPESGFEIREQRSVAIEGVRGPVTESVLQGEFQRVLSRRWVMGASGSAVEAMRGFLGLDRSGWTNSRRLLLVRISTPLGQSVQSRARAEARLREFAEGLVAQLDEITKPRTL